jgi:hypothetical protein
MTPKDSGTPWRIHFFQRHRSDDPNRSVPAIDFLDACPEQVAAEIHAVLDAVAAAPPPRFSGGGKWEAMHGAMASIYEVRVSFKSYNYRLFCVLERDADDLGGSSVVALGGLKKPRRQSAAPRDYRLVRGWADEFKRRRTVLS